MKINEIITGHYPDNHPEGIARRAMFAEWKRLPKNKRPKNPRALAHLMIDCFVAPKLDYSPSASEEYELQSHADKRFQSLVRAAKALRRELGDSSDVHVLPGLLASRIASGPAGEAAWQQLVDIEQAIKTIANAPPLRVRAARARPDAVKDPFVRAMVRAIYWYVDRFDPTASPRLLADFTIRALGHRPASLARHFEEVRNCEDWKDPSFDWWDNYPQAAPIYNC